MIINLMSREKQTVVLLYDCILPKITAFMFEKEKKREIFSLGSENHLLSISLSPVVLLLALGT